METPFLSVALASTVCGELGVTATVVAPLTERSTFRGGQVEKYPAAEVTSEVDAVMMVEPGRSAVAMPLGLVTGVVPVTGLGFVGFVVLLMLTTFALTAP